MQGAEQATQGIEIGNRCTGKRQSVIGRDVEIGQFSLELIAVIATNLDQSLGDVQVQVVSDNIDRVEETHGEQYARNTPLGSARVDKRCACTRQDEGRVESVIQRGIGLVGTVLRSSGCDLLKGERGGQVVLQIDVGADVR